MKKCPICGAVNSEKDDVCGVCSTGLADVSAESDSVSSIEHHMIRASSSQRTSRADRHKRGILGLIVGTVMMATGILMLELIALIGFLMVLFGFTVIATDISWMKGNTSYELDEPVLHGRARMHGYLHYPSRDDKEERIETEPPPTFPTRPKDREK